MEDWQELIYKKIQRLPLSPGVYLFKDQSGAVIYVGKAVRLRQRVSSYFRDDQQASTKTKALVKNIVDLDYLVTTSEVEALVLENNLIKKYQPRYNVRLRDDKAYQYVKITAEDFARVMVVRRMKKDGAKYFGPFTSGWMVKQTLQLVEKFFAYRKCRHSFFDESKVGDNLTRREALLARNPQEVGPCIEYQMGRCIGICQPSLASLAEHREIIKEVERFFEGKIDELVEILQNKMMEAAGRQDFEKAALLRDQIEMVKGVAQSQEAVMTDQKSRDVLGVAIEGKKACVELLKIRRGLLLSREQFQFDSGLDISKKEVVARALMSYYRVAQEIPEEILLPVVFEDQEVLQVWLKLQRESRLGRVASLSLLSPRRGHKRKVLDLASANAKEQLDKLFAKWLSHADRLRVALGEIREGLSLKRRPLRIECYDISHFGGTGTVASMVVFENGEPKKTDYRRFKIKQAEGGDDYKAMKEVLKRRFLYAQKAAMGIYGLRMRKASPKDLQEVYQVIASQGLQESNMDPDGVVCLKQGKELVAFGRLEVDSGYEGEEREGSVWVSSLWVFPKWRGNHLGYVVMSELIKRSVQSVLYVVCSEELVDYFAGFGWKNVLEGAENLQCRVGSGKKLLRYDRPKKSGVDYSFSTVPDLVVIDGGKGQLGVAWQVMRDLGLYRADSRGKGMWSGFAFAVVGLAKREEEIWLPVVEKDGSFSFKQADLAADSQGSLVIQAARDEAHRFANTYQKKVRESRWFK